MIVGVDPGGTTGVAIITSQGAGIHAITGGQLKPDEFADWFIDVVCTRSAPVYVACEKFTIGAHTLKKSRQYDALELIGVVKHHGRRASFQVEIQTPGTAKNLVTDTVLRNMGVFAKGAGHSNDAMRHALLLVARLFPQVFTSILDSRYGVTTTKFGQETKTGSSEWLT